MAMWGIAWSQVEIERLDFLAGDHSFLEVVRRYNAWAAANGYPARTDRAIERAGLKRGITFRPCGLRVTLGAIRDAIGCTQHQAYRILDRCRCHQRRKRARRYVLRTELKRLARRHPELFSAAPRENLVQLLEDENLADWIITHPPARFGISRPIRCQETGDTFPSIAAASRANFIHSTQIKRALHDGVTAAGFHWEYIP